MTPWGDCICNPRLPHGPSGFVLALSSYGSILNTTGPACRDLAGR
jgi:hypothetical protein